jgi:hypothetical protein
MLTRERKDGSIGIRERIKNKDEWIKYADNSSVVLACHGFGCVGGPPGHRDLSMPKPSPAKLREIKKLRPDLDWKYIKNHLMEIKCDLWKVL